MAVLKVGRYFKVLLNRKNKKIPKCCGSIKKLKMGLIFGNRDKDPEKTKSILMFKKYNFVLTMHF